MPLPTPASRPTVSFVGRAARAAGVGLLVAIVVAGCSSGPKSEHDADGASRAAQRTLGLSPAQTDCLRGKIDEDPPIGAALNTSERADAEQRAGYVRAIRACVPIEDFATLLGSTLPDAITGATETQSRCVHDQVLALGADEQDRLYLYFSNPASLDIIDIGPTSTKLATVCSLTDSAGPDASVPDISVTQTTTPPASTPGG